jgi:cytidyltransferase-like protein
VIVYTGGSFDLPHVGHVDLLNWCRLLAGNGKVVIALNTDKFIKGFKGHLPTLTYNDRKTMLLAFKGLVDEVVMNKSGKDSRPTILKVKPDIIVVGSDWLRKDYMKQMSFTPKWLEKNKIALCYIPRYLNISTTQIKERVKE